MKYIGITDLWLTPQITSEANATASLSNFLTNGVHIQNSHNGTFAYTQDDPEITDYINELSGKPYYRDKVSDGNKTIAFSMGEYDLNALRVLRGGRIGNGFWASGDNDELLYCGVVARVKTGNFIVFTNACLTTKIDTQEKGLMLGVTAMACDNPTIGVADEYFVDGGSVNLKSYAGNDGKTPITEIYNDKNWTNIKTGRYVNTGGSSSSSSSSHNGDDYYNTSSSSM